MALTNPTSLVDVDGLQRFKQKNDQLYATLKQVNSTASQQDIAELFKGDSLPGDASQFNVATTSEIIAMMEETEDGGDSTT